MQLYLGIFYATAAIGPAFGFILGGALLDTWVDPGKQPAGLEPESPEWVGAWWMGFVIVGEASVAQIFLCIQLITCMLECAPGFLGTAFAAVLFLFPKYLPGTKYIREEEKREADIMAKRRSK